MASFFLICGVSELCGRIGTGHVGYGVCYHFLFVPALSRKS